MMQQAHLTFCHEGHPDNDLTAPGPLSFDSRKYDRGSQPVALLDRIIIGEDDAKVSKA
jgi:hypothetical protein